jgi:hypothetical protein
MARLAGFLYLVLGLPGFFSLMYVPMAIMASGDAAATARNIMTHERLFRIGIVSNLISQTGFIFVTLALYRLLRDVAKDLASLMVLLFVISVPISYVNELNQVAGLSLLSGTGYLSAFEKPQLDALQMVFHGLYNHGNLLAQIFWGLWLFPLGILVYRSGFLPRILGVLLIVACFGYLAGSLTFLLWPAYGPSVSNLAVGLGGLGEGAFMLWLLIMGAKEERAGTRA